LEKGFVHAKGTPGTELIALGRVEKVMKAAVDAIWSYIRDFESLKIEIEE
jgi:hypothetical protein